MASTSVDYAPSGDQPAPEYTEHDGADLFARIHEASGLNLPILSWPPTPRGRYAEPLLSDAEYNAGEEIRRLQINIIISFFTSVEYKTDDLVIDFVSRGLVSPDVTNLIGETPLLAAVRVGNLPMVQRLISLGALVDGYGRSAERTPGAHPNYSREAHPERTALQEAAGRGNLAIVRVLMEEHGANDALIAPDGALALRLAAKNGHREIVQYLPARRGGGWQRWKTAHQKEMRVIRTVMSRMGSVGATIVWHIPRHLLWVYPKEFVMWSWERRRKFGGWVKRQIVSIPSRIKRAGKAVIQIIKELPATLKQMSRSIGRFLRAIPGAIKIFLNWIASGLKKTGVAVADAAKRILSALHTAAVAVLT